MACNTNRSNCTADSIFAAVANPNCGQFFNPANFQAEQFIYDSAFKDIINNFGIPVDYYIHTFNIQTADTIYGEQPTAVFYGPVSLMMYIELTENAINLSKFGFATDDELTGFVHIKTFEEAMTGREFYIRATDGDILLYSDYIEYLKAENNEELVIKTNESFKTQIIEYIALEESSTDNFPLLGADYTIYNKYINNNQDIEPKSGDLIQLSPLGCDRPNGRGAKIFEVTERTDQDISQINPLLGHYVYRLRAKRYEYSFEPGAPQEPRNDQIFESSFSGKLSSSIEGEEPSQEKVYNSDINKESKTKVLDMSVNDTDIYGSYY